MLAVCRKCGAILEYDPKTGCMECPNDKYDTAWIEAEYTIAGWRKVALPPD